MAKRSRRRVTFFVHDGNGRVLVGRHKKAPPGKKSIAVPGGGVEKGQNVERAAKAEALEEAGVKVKDVKPIGIAPKDVPLPNGGKDYKDGKYTHIRQYWRVGLFDGEDKSIKGSEGDGLRSLRFMDIDKAITLLEEMSKDPENDNPKWARQQADALRRVERYIEKAAADEDPKRLLVKFGPPNEWSGCIAGVLGPDRRRMLVRAWKGLSKEERARVQKQFSAADSLGEKVAVSIGQVVGAANKTKAYYDILPKDKQKTVDSVTDKVTPDLAKKPIKLVKDTTSELEEAKKKLLKHAGLGLLSKEKRQAHGRADALHRSDKPEKWDTFLEHAKRKSYAQAIDKDSRSDDKLRRHTDQMNRLLTGKALDTVKGRTGTYKIIRKRGGGLACTCPDWRYRRSVAGDGEQDCRHILAFKFRRKFEKSAELAHELLHVARMPRTAKVVKRIGDTTSSHVAKLLKTEIPGTGRLRLMSKEKAHRLADTVARNPETAVLGGVGLVSPVPGASVGLPATYLKGKKALTEALKQSRLQKGHVLKRTLKKAP